MNDPNSSVSDNSNVSDSRRARSEATRGALMRAAEKLIAEGGIGAVSIRGIVSAAGQKNESALQYHFKNLDGLIAAIHRSRGAEIQLRRTQLLEALEARPGQPTLRELCSLMVRPAFDLARSKPDFRRYVKAFGHEIALAENSALDVANRRGGEGEVKLGTLLLRELGHLDAAGYRRRMEAAVRLCAASMYHEAARKSAFRGQQAELFFHSLIDALEGLLSAPESEDTRRLAAAGVKSKGRKKAS